MFESGEKIFTETGKIVGHYADNIVFDTVDGYTLYIPENRITCMC